MEVEASRLVKLLLLAEAVGSIAGGAAESSDDVGRLLVGAATGLTSMGAEEGFFVSGSGFGFAAIRRIPELPEAAADFSPETAKVAVGFGAGVTGLASCPEFKEGKVADGGGAGMAAGWAMVCEAAKWAAGPWIFPEPK